MPFQAEKVYEQFANNPVARDGIRPGGLTLTQRLMRLADFPPGSRILDVGCGSGVTLEYIGRMHCYAQVLGIDSSLKLLDFAKTAHNLKDVVNANVSALPLRDSSFDGIISECCLSVMSYSRGHMEELFRVLKSGGKLLVSDVYLRADLKLAAESEFSSGCCLTGAITRTGIVNRLAESGFIVSNWEDHSQLLKDFAVRWILENGSMNSLWNLMSRDGTATSCFTDRIRESKPGYYLLVAQKIFSETSEVPR